MTAERRRVRVTEANLRNATLPVTGLRDYFPAEAVGGPRRKNGSGHGFELILDGMVLRLGSHASAPRNNARKPACSK